MAGCSLRFGARFQHNIAQLPTGMQAKAHQVVDVFADARFHQPDGWVVDATFYETPKPDGRVKITLFPENQPDNPAGGLRLPVVNFLQKPKAMRWMLWELMTRDYSS